MRLVKYDGFNFCFGNKFRHDAIVLEMDIIFGGGIKLLPFVPTCIKIQAITIGAIDMSTKLIGSFWEMLYTFINHIVFARYDLCGLSVCLILMPLQYF
ncbi:hypothetical protein, partial [Candidatus Liberibacter sp.]|uniref:hypothetical protein n=1 Tax=Candidatus Liberibacter sp. TaxID=34022 RepID=UPI001C712236